LAQLLMCGLGGLSNEVYAFLSLHYLYFIHGYIM